MKRLSLIALTLWLALPSLALASTTENGEEEFDPSHEFELHEWIPIHLGPLDLSINKAVAYLILGTICTIALGVFLMRAPIGSKNEVGRRQTVGEMVYEIAQVQVAEQGLPHKAIGTLVPVRGLAAALHLDDQHDRLHPAAALGRDGSRSSASSLPTLAIYAATSSISVTLALALHDVDLHARRGHPRQRRRPGTSRAGSRTCRRRSTR